MTKKEWYTNIVLALMVALLIAICVRSIVGEASNTHRQPTEHARDN